MSRNSVSKSRTVIALVGAAIGVVLGASAFAAPGLDEVLQRADSSTVLGMSGSNGRGMSGSNGRGMSGSNGRGMSGSNGRGMSGSNGRGMSGSNGRGMSGSNGRGMSGSNGRGMSGSNGRGMSGSNGRGMSGSNGRGMSGSNGRGMSGSNGRGMSGSNGRGMSGSNGRGMSGSNGRVSGGTFASGFDLAAMGPVEKISVDGRAATVVVAGQQFAIPADDVSEFEVGDYVVAGASETAKTAAIYHVGIPYVPGASAVRVRATVNMVEPAVAQLTLGTLTVDYAQQLATDPGFSVTTGESIEVVGVQPSPLGVLLVSSSGEGASIIATSAGEVIADRR